MKLLVVLFAFVICSAYANISPSAPTHCDYKCTKLDLPTCAYNGRCYLQMTGLCALEKYNCLNPQRAFRQVDQYKCGEDSAPQCQTGDY